MRAILLTVNLLLLMFMLLNVANWYAANSHLPFLGWSMYLPSPIPFTLLLASLPFMPYRGAKQWWLVAQAFVVGITLAFSWLAHMDEIVSNTVSAVSFTLAVAFLTFNLKAVQRARNATSRASFIPYTPAAMALIAGVFVAYNESLRPVDGNSIDQLFQRYQKMPADAPEAVEISAQIKTIVVGGMVQKGYSREYSEAIARDTQIQYLVPLVKDWKLVHD